MYRVGIITMSDKGSMGDREDVSGQVIADCVRSVGFQVTRQEIIPDEQDQIESLLCQMADEDQLDLILTTGGTGFSLRDVTPEATLAVAHRLVPGISEAIRQYSLTFTKRAMLSRAVSVIRGGTLIVNLPGSPKAVRESLEYIIDSLDHGLRILKGDVSECAR